MKMKVPKNFRFEYVCCLPSYLERQIMAMVRKAVNELLLDKEEKQEAMENAWFSKVCNLEDTIRIRYIA